MIKLRIRKNNFYGRNYYRLEDGTRVRLDNREFIDGVPLSSTMEIVLKIREAARELKYKVKHLGK